MKTLLTIAFLTLGFFLAKPAVASTKACASRPWNAGFSLRAEAPQGFLIFVFDDKAESSRSALHSAQSFCRRGFHSIVIQSSMLKANTPALEERMQKSHFPTLIFGSGKASNSATQFALVHLNKTRRLILENASPAALSLVKTSHGLSRKTRVFTCEATSHALNKNAVVMSPTDRRFCRKSFLKSQEARDPMTEYIEKDFAGIPAGSWFFRRKI